MISTNRQTYSSIATSSTSSPYKSSTSQMPPARGTKTLAWFMDQTDLLKGQQQQQQMQQGGGSGPQPIGVGRRGSSSDDSKSTPPSHHHQQQYYHHHPQQQALQSLQKSSSTSSSTSSPQHHHHQNQQQKQKKYRKTTSGYGSQRKEAFQSAGQAMSSESSEDGTTTTTTVLPRPVTLTTSSNGTTVPTSSSSGVSSSGVTGPSGATSGAANDEYWFYDVASDGYYYEQNGAKGWRRRQPNAAVHKGNGKDQEVAHMNVNGPTKYNQLLAAQTAAAHAAFMQQALFHAAQAQAQAQQAQTTPTTGGGATVPPPLPQAPTMRYYDPNSDGFFYEMASVDGWKRRQPNKPVSASVPGGGLGITRPYSQRPTPTASYGAALARGQFPRNTVKQEASEALTTTSSTTTTTPAPEDSESSQCGDTFAELFHPSDPLFNPIQRPSALNLEQKAVSPQLENAAPGARPMDSTAALFEAVLADFNGGKTHNAYNSSNLNSLLPPPPGGWTPSTQQHLPQQSPMKESWNSFRSCSLFSPLKPSKRVLAPSGAPFSGSQPMGGAIVGGGGGVGDEFEDDTMTMLMRDLDKLWANTPVSGLNLA